MSAVPRRGGTGPKGERGRAAAQAAARGKGGACAARFNGEALRQRKAPHGAGLVRVAAGRGFMPRAAGAGVGYMGKGLY